jgi:hypothetical protein
LDARGSAQFSQADADAIEMSGIETSAKQVARSPT